MANDIVNQSSVRVATYEYVINGFEQHRDQLHALAVSLVRQLRPNDPKNPEDGCNLVAWRLSEIMYDMLSSGSLETSSRDMLMAGVNHA